MIIFKVPAVPGMIGGTLVGVVFAFTQGFGFSEILINPVIAIIYGFTGFGLARLDPNKPIKNRVDEEEVAY